MNYAELLDYSDNQFCHIAELNKTNKKLEIRIAELENKIKGSAYLHMAAQMMIYLVEGREIVGSDWDYINDSQYEECQKAITIRDLRQQAKGIDWVLACRELNLSEGEVHTLMDKCNKLRKQADELEQVE